MESLSFIHLRCLKKLIGFLFIFFPQHIPAYFVKKYFSSNKHVGDVILSMSDGRNWTVKYSCPKFTTKLHGKFYCGWNEFALDNNLKVGDVCAFELIEGTQMHFKVSIFRFTEEHCPLSGEGSAKFFKSVPHL